MGPLISRPKLTDQLLARPPFKFLFDIIANLITGTVIRFSVVPGIYCCRDLRKGCIRRKSSALLKKTVMANLLSSRKS